MDGTVLVADDDRTIRTVLTQALTRAGCRVHATASLATLLRWVEEGKGDLVITDVMMPDGNGIDTLPKIKSMRPGMPVIVISAQNTIMTAIKATEAEAWDYLPKPFDLPDLLGRASKALDVSSRNRQRGSGPLTDSRIPGRDDAGEQGDDTATDLPLVGRTPSMQALYRLVARVMNAELSVVIQGESGTGKSLIAKALHDFSERASHPFIILSAQDFLSETSPTAALQRGSQGTLVIDGLGDLDGAAQARLVRLLDSLEGRSTRIIALADAALDRALETGHFRQDLYYRLAGLTLHVPPLRDRIEDIPLLADHFLAKAARDGMARDGMGREGAVRDSGPRRSFSPGAIELMRQFRWPGNVRQLENTVRRLVVTGVDPLISREELAGALGAGPGAETSAAMQADTHGTGTLSDSVARHVRRYFELHGDALPPSGVYQRILREVEAPLIDIALEYTGGNQAKCADLLGINRNTLRKKTNDLDIRVTRRRKLM